MGFVRGYEFPFLVTFVVIVLKYARGKIHVKILQPQASIQFFLRHKKAQHSSVRTCAGPKVKRFPESLSEKFQFRAEGPFHTSPGRRPRFRYAYYQGLKVRPIPPNFPFQTGS